MDELIFQKSEKYKGLIRMVCTWETGVSFRDKVVNKSHSQLNSILET